MLSIRAIVLFGLLLTLNACRIIQEVPEGGSIQSSSGSFDCAEGQVCEIDVENVTAFTETFTAIPSPGYQLVGWGPSVAGEKASICGKTEGSCKVNLPGEFTSYNIDAYLLPIFEAKASWNYWQAEDVKTLDGWGENADEHADLIALYQKAESDHLAFRVDYINLTGSVSHPHSWAWTTKRAELPMLYKVTVDWSWI